MTADRADITGAGGRPLVTERPVLRFGIDKANVPAASAGTSARRLARLVGIDPAAYAERVAAAGPKAFVEAIVLRPADAGSKRGAAAGDPGGRASSATPCRWRPPASSRGRSSARSAR